MANELVYFCSHCESRFTLHRSEENPRCPNCLKKTSIEKRATEEEKQETFNALETTRSNGFVLLVILSLGILGVVLFGPQTRAFGWWLMAAALMGFVFIVLWVLFRERQLSRNLEKSH